MENTKPSQNQRIQKSFIVFYYESYYDEARKELAHKEQKKINGNHHKQSDQRGFKHYLVKKRQSDALPKQPA